MYVVPIPDTQWMDIFLYTFTRKITIHVFNHIRYIYIPSIECLGMFFFSEWGALSKATNSWQVAGSVRPLNEASFQVAKTFQALQACRVGLKR